MQTKISREARNDAMEIATFIAEDNIDAAFNFLESLEETIGTLSRNPLVGSLRIFEDSELPSLRFWPVKRFRNYLIAYIAHGNELRIIRILNVKRDFSLIFGNE